MNLKMTLFFVATAMTTTAFALPLKSAPYSGLAQERVSSQNTQVVGTATLTEVNRAVNSRQDAEFLFRVSPARDAQGLLKTTEFAILSLELSQSSRSGASVSFPAVLNLQNEIGIDGEEPVFKASSGNCGTDLEPRPNQTVVCDFSNGIRIEIK
jgi:hypothetical protein